jgi:cytoskeletal protein CcmA (bactofilin family)
MNQSNQHPGGFVRHFDEITCLQYLEGLLDRPTARELSAHTDQCTECRELMHALERETRLLSNALREQEEAVPAHLLTGPVRDKTPWAWVAAFGMAAAGVYWLWTSFIDPAMAQASELGYGGTDLLTKLFFNGALWKGWESMWSLFQGVGLISLGVIGFFLLRRGLRKFNTFAVVMTALLVALGIPVGASAAEIHRNETHFVLPADATVKNDLIVFADSAQIDGTVEGDVVAFGRSVTVTGHVMGDVISFGSVLQISGTVDGNVRSFANQFTLHGKIGKNLTAFSGTMLADAQSQIGWSVTVFAGDATLDGRIERDILGYFGHLEINGFVGGNIEARANESFTMGAHAHTLGTIKYKGTNQPVISNGSQLASAVETTIEVHRADVFAAVNYWHKLLFWGAAFVLGMLLILIAPEFFTETVRSADRVGVSLGVGALGLIATPILAILACFTVVGLGVGISTLLLWLIADYASKVFIATWIGRAIVGKKSFVGVAAGSKTWPVPYKGALIGQLALGLLLIDAARLIPYAGFLAYILLHVWGFGAVALTIYRRIHPDSAVAASVAPVVATV